MENKQFTLDKLLNVVQVLAIVISGCWIFFKYISHEKIANELTNENLKMQKDNLQLQNNLHNQIDNYTVHITQLELEKAKQDSKIKENDLKYMERMSLSELNTRKLNNESQLISLKYAEEFANLNKQHSIIQNKKDVITYKRDIDNRYEATVYFTCKLIDSVKKLYLGNIKCEIKNISEVSYDISAVIVNLYVSKFELTPSNNPNILLNTITYPPNIYDEKEEKLTDWKLIEQNYFLSWNCSSSFKSELKNDLTPIAKITVPTFYTGELKSGAKGLGNYKFYFTSDIDNIIGIRMGMFFNDQFVHGYSFGDYKVLKYLQFSTDNF